MLCRRSEPDNIAVFAQYIGILGQVEDPIVDCFRLGGGVAYEHYRRFHEVMAEDSGQTVLAALDEHILPLLYTLSTMHCMTVSLARDGAGLGTMWGEELAVEMLGKAGFERVEVRQLEHDFQNNFYVMCKG